MGLKFMGKDIFKPLDLIRALTGIIKDDKSYLMEVLALVNLLLRGAIRESDWDFVKETTEKNLGIELIPHNYLCPTCLSDYETLKGSIFCCSTKQEIEEAIKEEDKDIF